MPAETTSHAQRLLRPLRFAAKDHFANLPRMVELGTICAEILGELVRTAAPPEAQALAAAFRGLDRLPPEQKRDLIWRGIWFAESLLGLPQTPRPSAPAPVVPVVVPPPAPVEPAPVPVPAPAPSVAAEPRALYPTDLGMLAKPAAPKRPVPPPLPPLAASAPVEQLPGVGPQGAAHLKAAGIHTVLDLLSLAPKRYVDLRGSVPVSLISQGEGATGSITGQVVGARIGFGKGGRRLEVDVEVQHEHTKVKVYYFRIPGGYQQRFTRGAWVTLSGKISMGARGPQMAHPKAEFHGNAPPDGSPSGNLEIQYEEVDGLQSKSLARLVRSAAERAEVEDHLPSALRQELGLLPLGDALRQVHAPPKDLPANEVRALEEGSHPARRRLAFDEIFALQLGLALRAQKTKQEQGITILPKEEPTAQLGHLLPFSLTGAQRRSIQEITHDLSGTAPMNRILVGEVGSGKTVVALGAALPVLDAGLQVVLMAPTELLAVQHAERLLPLASRAGHEVALILSKGGRGGRARGATAAGMAGLVIGTHALLEEAVTFRRLALAIIDEQHRFGVEQRARLMQKSETRPHLLVMTATPIPRTLALTLYGDLDLSVLDELPPGRTPIKTEVLSFSEQESWLREIEDELARGGQVFVICPRIDAADELETPDAITTAKDLEQKLPGRRVGLVHGRQSAEERGQAMRAFARGAVSVLVSTTVVEVGVDVPNASLMVILGADRFGLSQLHQLRGRVGRGARESKCLLVATGSTLSNEETRKRLRVLASCHDGFRLAEEDLKLRGPGEFLGTKQSGAPDMAMTNLFRDAALLGRAREAARSLVAQDPGLARSEHQGLRTLVSRKLGAWVEGWLS